MSEKFLDYSRFRDSFLISWREVVPETSSDFYSNILALFDVCFKLPHHELQKKLIVATILTPSAIATNLPITFLWGPSGSGKSKVGTLASKLYGVQPLLEGSTTASIRNTLDERKYIVHPEEPEVKLEQNTILTWDDIRPFRISPDNNDNIFGLLKSGCSRMTSKSRIALSGGKVQEFCTFGIKIISSIHAHWAMPGCEELKRRAMIFVFEASCDKNRTFVDVDLLDVSELEMEVKLFWRSDTCREFQVIKKALSKVRTIHKEFLAMSLDVLTTLCLFEGISPSELNSLYLIPYQELIRLPLLNKSITLEFLEQFVEEKTLAQIAANKEFAKQGLELFIEHELTITSQEAVDFLKKRIADGSLDLPRLDNLAVHQLMKRVGFEPKSTRQGLLWVKRL